MPTGNQTERVGSAVKAGLDRPQVKMGGEHSAGLRHGDLGEPAKKAGAAAVCRSTLASLCDRVSYVRAGHSTVLYSTLLQSTLG